MKATGGTRHSAATIRGKGRPRKLAGLALVAALAIGLGASATAQAMHEDGIENDPFTPTLSFSTSTDQAGDHPDLTIEMHKRFRNQCLDYAENPGPISAPGRCNDMYIEENLRKLTVRFPPGALPDPNAAPYCELRSFGVYQGAGIEVFGCANEDALVGVADVTAQDCREGITGLLPFYPDACLVGSLGDGFCFDPQRPPSTGYTEYLGYATAPPLPPQPPAAGPTYTCRSLGYAYNEEPRKDEGGRRIEEGHLVILWPRWPKEIPDPLPPDPASLFDPVGGYVAPQVSHVSVRVRASDLGVDSVAELPDYIPSQDEDIVIPGQPSDVVLTLFGNKGAEKGHPLLTNPTFCDPQAVEAEFLGYAHNSQDDPNLSGPFDYIPGYGDGKTVTDSVGVQATGCDQVPYAPNLDLKLSTTKASEVPAVEATVTQPQGEATNQSSTVTFPSGFKVNDKNKATYCGDADIQKSVDDPDADHCPESSRIGTVEASSYVLPESEPPLKGGVYLKALSGDSVEFSALLEGFVDLRFDAKAKLGDDLTLVNRFEGLPSVPLSKFVLKLEGGDKGLLRNPKICGTQTVKSVFESHSKKQAVQEIPIAIEGCTDPFLDAELSERHRGANTNLDLSLSPSLTPVALDSVEFQLARHLHWGLKGNAEAAKKKGKAKTATSVGTIVFTTPTKNTSVRLSAKRSKRGNISFTPLQRSGQSLGELSTFSASLVRTRRRQPRITARGKDRRTGKRVRRQADLLILSGMPKGDLNGVELNLKGTGKSRSFYLKNPKGCKRPLNFVARATSTDGQKIALSDKVKLRCPKRRARKG